MTKEQKIILETVMQPGRHLTADEIYLAAKKEIPNIALGTVYRSLNLFADEHKIRRFHRVSGPDFFDGTLTPHEHIICARCGKISDVDLPGLTELVGERVGTDILSVDITISYICPDCRGKQTDK